MNYIGQNFPTEDEELPSTTYANIARMNAEGSAPLGGSTIPTSDPNDPVLIGGRAKKNSKPAIMSKDEADQYLASRRAETTQGQSTGIMSKDEADDYLASRRAQQSQSVSQTPTVPSGARQQSESQELPQGAGLSILFHKLPPGLQNVIREHPYLSGAAAAAAVPLAVGAGALVPEAALGTGAMWLGRNLLGPVIRRGAEVAGVGGALDLLTGGHFTPKLIDLISRLGEESGVAP